MNQVRQRLTTAEVQDKRLRFILRGRLLAADAVTLVQCGIRSGDTVHCVLSEGGHETAGEDVASTGPVDAPLSRTTTPNFGFDRLREAGYNDDEIGALRQQFHLHNGLVREDDGIVPLFSSQVLIQMHRRDEVTPRGRVAQQFDESIHNLWYPPIRKTLSL